MAEAWRKGWIWEKLGGGVVGECDQDTVHEILKSLIKYYTMLKEKLCHLFFGECDY